MEAFSTKVSASTYSYFEIAGLLKKIKNNMMMTRNRENACESIGGTYDTSGQWIARYCPVKDFWLASKAWLGVLGEFGGVLYTDHVRFDPRHPYYYYYKACTAALITNIT